MSTKRAALVGGFLLSAWILGAAETRAGLESRGQNFPLDLPTPEFSPSTTLLGNLGAQDEAVEVWGEPDGELVMITKEDRTLWAATSVDSGATFAPAVRFAGPPFEAPIDRFEFVATGNTLYVAYLAGDPGGDVGLKLRSSSDMGRTWSLPSVLVARGNLRHGLDDLALHAVDGGRVAVLFHDAWEGRDVYAMVSSDYGITWTTPVRLDAANAEGVRPSEIGDVQVSTTGTVHATFVQRRTAGNRIWYTRSIDGGATFTPEITFDSVIATNNAKTPDIATFVNGTVLIAWWDGTTDPNTDLVTVVRSVNDGASFTLSAQRSLFEPVDPVQPRLLTATNFPDALLAWLSIGELHVALTQDTGLTFVGNTIIGGSAVAEYGMARTLSNEWALAYSSREWKPRVEVAVSTNGGITWGFPERADQGPGAAAESLFGSVTIAGASQVFVAYRDRRDDLGASYNVYAADSPIAALDFTGRERRVDTDVETSHYIPTGGTLASDGASRLYMAMPILTEGHGAEMWVTRSSDGARTWQPIQRVSAHDTAVHTVEEPLVRALPDGSVYLVWRRREVTVDLDYWDELVFVRSTDFGATWGPEVILTGPIQYVYGSSYTLAASSISVVVLWEEGNEILVRRSTNQGDTFSTATSLSASPGSYSQYPLACAQGNRFVFLYQENNPTTGVVSPVARVSGSGGASWFAAQNIRPSSVFGDAAQNMSLECDSGTGAVALWAADHLGSNLHIESSRLSLVHDWSAPVNFPVTDAWYNDVAWAGGSNYVATLGDGSATSVWTSRSTDGGLTWSVPLRHDDSAPQPITTSYKPQVASDGAGNVWFSWWDPSPGRGSIAMRHSANGGATFGPIRRADRTLPQGVSRVHPEYGLWAGPSLGVLMYGADRATSYGDVRIQTWDALDLDRDGSADAADCDDESAAVYPGAPEACDGFANDCNGAGWPSVPANELDPDADLLLSCADNCPAVSNTTQANQDGDTLGDACDPDIDGDGVANDIDCAPMDPTVSSGPVEVFPVQINKPTATTFQIVWDPVAGATAYDVARGTVTGLRTTGDTSGATAQSCGQAGTTYSDNKPITPGTAWYFIIRGRAGTCTGGWGSTSASVPRVSSACP